MPGIVVHGTATIAWLEGERFLLLRARTDHPDVPDSLSVIGDVTHDRVHGDGGEMPAAYAPSLRMHYFDARGVFRAYETRIDEASWQWWRDATGFSQRFTGRFADGGDTIVGRSQVCEDGVQWTDDLAITYRRRQAP